MAWPFLNHEKVHLRNLRIGQECLQAEKEILQAEKEDLRAERNNLRSQENIFQSEWYTFQNERDTLQSERDIFQNERDTLQSKLDCLQSERDTLQSKLNCLQSERDTFQRERDTLQSQLNSLQTELHALQSNFHAVTEKLVQAELERQNMKNNQPDQPQEAPQLISVAPVRGRKVKRISLPSEQETAKRESPGEGPSTRCRSPTPTRATTTERDIETLTTRPLKMTELQVLRKDFTRHPGEHIVTWLL
ncbi:girdin-like [Numida meleagris]|uniref:girdin-like n=1 Tax=Numida meleagris TaxID=8996 RepID=UPI000B3DE5D7|nr:girdin-like [Numida meleagris]